MMSPSEIEYYVQKRREGWDNSQVRKELESLGYSKDDLFYYLNQIDDSYVTSVNEKSDFTLNNVSTRLIELIVGIGVFLTGLSFLGLCVLYGPGFLSLFIGVVATSSGYYFLTKGLRGLININKASKRKSLLYKSNDILDK